MRRGDLMDDWQEHRKRYLITAAVVLLVIGLTVGAALAVIVTRLFDAANLDEFARDFSRPGAAGPAVSESR